MSTSGSKPLIYVVRMDVEPGREADFDDWYARQHAPDVVLGVPGFRSARSYRSVVGAPWVCSVYEIDGTDLFGSEEYKNVAPNDPRIDEVRHWLSGHTASIYEAVEEAADEPHASGPWFGLPWMTTIRFAADDPVAWFSASGSETLRDANAVATVLARRHSTHPRTPCLDPEWVVLTDWATEAAAHAGASAVADDLASAGGQEVAVNVVGRVYEVLRSDSVSPRA